MDANEAYLNDHMSSIDRATHAAAHAAAWKADYIEELLAKGGEYYPWNPVNTREAIEQTNEIEGLTFYAYINSCRKNPDNEFIQKSAMENTVIIVERYWQNAAVKKADKDYDTHYGG